MVEISGPHGRQKIQMDSSTMRGVHLGKVLSDNGTPITTLSNIFIVAQAGHELCVTCRNLAGVHAGRVRGSGIAIAGERWTHDVKGVLRTPSKALRIR